MKQKNNKSKLYALIALYIVIYYLWIVIFKDTGRLFIIVSNIFQTVPSLIVSVVLFKVYMKKHDEKDLFWLIILIGIMINFIGQMTRNYYEIILKVATPNPGLPDLFWNIAAILYLIALFYKFHNRIKNRSVITLAIDVMTTMCVAIAITWVYIVYPLIVNIESLKFMNLLAHIVYPVIDLVLLCGVISLYVSLQKDDIERKYIFKVILSFFILFISNSIYTYIYTMGNYRTGNFVDPLWSLYMLIMLVSVLEYKSISLKQKSCTNNRGSRGIFFAGTNLSVILLFGFMVYEQDLVVWICSALSIVLINIRQILMYRQNKNLIKDLSNLNENLESKVRQRTEEIYKMAFSDFLTKLPNRRALELKLNEVLLNYEEDAYNKALIILDLDKFKLINDTFGHVLGDLLLKEIASRLNRFKREGLDIFRQGGDEFAIVIEKISKKEDVYKIVKEILNEISKPIDLDGHRIYITCSIGIAMYPEHGENSESIIKHADRAMNHSKMTGKNTYTIYNSSLEKSNYTYLEIEKELHDALENNEFELYYQPQVDILDGEIIGAEALIRWIHPTKGIIPPLDFIPLAEETGLIHNIGEWAIRTACIQGKTWHDIGFNNIKVAVNISGYQFQNESFVSDVEAILKETEFNPHYLDLEITETVAMEVREDLIYKLKELKKLGIKVSMDDFGTGYSSLSYLREFPIDTLKIPREFIKDIDIIDNKNIIESIIAIAQNLGLHIIAEGVESQKQLNFFKSKEDIYVQGYLYSKPVPNYLFEEFLENGDFKNQKSECIT